MRDREEEVTRHKRIKFLSELLFVAHKHKDYFDSVGEYDNTRISISTIKNALASAKSARITNGTISRRQKIRQVAKNNMQSLFTTPRGHHRPLTLRVGGKPKAERIVKNGSSSFEITVGWMWVERVWKKLYSGCANRNYGDWVILQAETVRVNSKHVELFEVLAFHKQTGDTINGYVAKTKSPRKSCIFNQKATLAVRGAENELQSELNLLLKGTSND